VSEVGYVMCLLCDPAVILLYYSVLANIRCSIFALELDVSRVDITAQPGHQTCPSNSHAVVRPLILEA